MCFLSSCLLSSFRSVELGKTNRQLEILDQTAEIIIKSFNENDLDMLRTVLSSKALESDDLEKGFAYSCELMGSEISEITRKGCPIGGYWDSGKSSEKGDASFDIMTKSGKKLGLYFEYWYSNDFDEALVGLNRIELYEQDAMDEQFKSGRLYEQSGIYNPDWDNE